MQYTQKSFTVPQTGKVDSRRDCGKLGHWPRTNQKGVLVCWYCGKACQSDGTDARETSNG